MTATVGLLHPFTVCCVDRAVSQLSTNRGNSSAGGGDNRCSSGCGGKDDVEGRSSSTVLPVDSDGGGRNGCRGGDGGEGDMVRAVAAMGTDDEGGGTGWVVGDGDR